VHISEFSGQLDPSAFIDWIKELKRYFDMENLEEDNPRRVKVAVTKLKSHAALWWDNLQTSRQGQGKEKIRLWPKMLKHMKAKFLPFDYEQELFQQYQNLRQRDLSVHDVKKIGPLITYNRPTDRLFLLATNT